MKVPILADWPRTTAAAQVVQAELRDRVICIDRFGEIRHVAGVDVGFEDHYKTARAAVAVLSFPELALQEQAIAYAPTPFPYVPGFLSFREVPVILQALAKLSLEPDLILCDGQGYAHPRRFGLACHLGVLLDWPTLGVAKSRLVGTHQELGLEKGAQQPLWDRGEQVGVVLRSRSNVRPLYISSGHRVSLETAVELTLRCTPKYRLPETTRWADKLASNRGAVLGAQD